MNSEGKSVPRSTVESLLVSFYCWMVITLFGAVLLDTVYAGIMRRTLVSGQTAAVSSEVSDFLLLMFAITVPAAVLAILSCRSKSARNLFAASTLLLLGELLVPFVFGSLLSRTHVGTWIRLFLSSSASLLALMGLNRFYLRR